MDEFFNSIEAGLPPKDNGWTLKILPAKRLKMPCVSAALFHLFSGKTGDISVEHIEQAITLMNWYLMKQNVC